jgi:hypothetical protein
MLYYATIARLVGLANEFWNVIETCVAVFLIVQIDDFVFFVVRDMKFVQNRLGIMYTKTYECPGIGDSNEDSNKGSNVVVGPVDDEGKGAAVMLSYVELYSPVANFLTFWRYTAEFYATFVTSLIVHRATKDLADLGCDGTDSTFPDMFTLGSGLIIAATNSCVIGGDLYKAYKEKSNEKDKTFWPKRRLAFLSATGWIALSVSLYFSQPGRAMEKRDWKTVLIWVWFYSSAFLIPYYKGVPHTDTQVNGSQSCFCLARSSHSNN